MNKHKTINVRVGSVFGITLPVPSFREGRLIPKVK